MYRSIGQLIVFLLVPSHVGSFPDQTTGLFIGWGRRCNLLGNRVL
jgi:hypothetical protein